MIQSLNTAATGMIAQQFNLDTISNNLANVNTTGFKSQRAEFQDMMYQTSRISGSGTEGDAENPQAVQIGMGARYAGSGTNFAVGPPQATGDQLHMLINGQGFFAVEKPDGTRAYTRDGSFKLDANGLMVNSDGFPLVPNVTVPVGATSVTISVGGIVSGRLAGEADVTELGQVMITSFPNPGGLTRLGQNLYSSNEASGEPTETLPGLEGSGTIQSGYVEGSNVQVVEEMVRMILAQRAYEINSKAIQSADDMLSILNNLKR